MPFVIVKVEDHSWDGHPVQVTVYGTYPNYEEAGDALANEFEDDPEAVRTAQENGCVAEDEYTTWEIEEINKL